MIVEFQKVLKAAGMDERKEGISRYKRRKITLHSFRRFVKIVISNQVNQDYSEWFLGHTKSSYYVIKEQERRKIYAEKCMKYLTFLDYTILDAAGKSVEAKLSEKDQEIEALKKKMAEMESMMYTIGEKLEVDLELFSYKVVCFQVCPLEDRFIISILNLFFLILMSKILQMIGAIWL